MRSMIRFAAPLVLALLVSACGPFKYQNEVYTLETTTWRILEVDGVNTDQNVARDLRPHVVFDTSDGRAHGATGCNRFSGSYSATGSELSFGEFVTTRSACRSPEATRMEASILEIMPTLTSYRIEGNRIWMYAGQEMRIAGERW